MHTNHHPIAPASQVGQSTLYRYFNEVNVDGFTYAGVIRARSTTGVSGYKMHAATAAFNWRAMSLGTERKSQQYADGVHSTELAMKPAYLVDKMSHAEMHEHLME
jgi:hypothetical protein